MGSVEDFHLVVFVFWCESKELGGRGSSRFPCVTAMVETSSDRVSEYYIKNSVRHQRWSSFAKRANGINNLTVSAKKASLQTSDLIPNADLTKRYCKFEGVGVWGGGGWNESAWNWWPQAGAQGSGRG